MTEIALITDDTVFKLEVEESTREVAMMVRLGARHYVHPSMTHREAIAHQSVMGITDGRVLIRCG